MKKNSFILLILTFFCANVSSQDIKPYFTIIPDNILGYVNIGLRKDLIDLYNANQNAEVRNLLGGTTRMTFLSPQFLKLNLSDFTDVEMRMIQEQGDSMGVVIVNKTLKTAYPESVLSVYTTDWRLLPVVSYFSEPSFKDFLSVALSDDDLRELERAIPYPVFKIEMDSLSSDLHVYPEFIRGMSMENIRKWKSFFEEKPIVYVWKEGRYEKM